MATKGERFKAEAQRAAHGVQPPRPPEHNHISKPHNPGPTHTKNSVYELELSGTARPSRKSTRKSLNRAKVDHGLHMATLNRTSSPKARADRGSGGRA
jgi:hypothetical protein